MALHLIKLCVGCDNIEELLDWRREHAAREPDWRLRTRQTPKRAAELIEGGSVYRVFKGMILCRQPVLAVETVGEGVAARCEIVLSPDIVRVAPTPRRAFQGWRYLEANDAPQDLEAGETGSMPPELAIQLRAIGAW